MSILVAYKYAANPQDASVNADGSLDWSRAKKSVSEYDPVAAQVGRDLADALGTELVGISVGTADIASGSAKKNAMSKGFDRGVILADDALAQWGAVSTAGALAEVVKREENPRLILTGDASVDEGARLFSALLAAHLGIPCFQNVSSIELIDAGNDTWQVVQNLPGGASRTLSIQGQAVLALTSDAATPKAPSMKEILAAAKKPVEVLTCTDIPSVQPAEPVSSTPVPAQTISRKNITLEGSPEEIASQLVEALRADGVL
ncbi:MAG: electron transfer flavoprotein beta subunit/FixA family protein [Actinomycetaceae bacterium]|nr:electron transfer flavoprotein beta subunit/FixA family protein [Actinomycetaceae bacterium]